MAAHSRAVRSRLPSRPVGPESFDEIDAQTSEAPHSSQRARLITATHEAGHAVIGTIVGFKGITVRLAENSATGANSLEAEPEPGSDFASMLVAGYAAVGVLLGDDAKQANLSGDQHHLPDSDLVRGLECAKAQLGDAIDPDGQWEYLKSRETEVLDFLNDERVRDAVKHAAAELFHKGILQPGLLGHILDLRGL